MRDDRDDNYISVGGWMLLMIIPAIPVIGWIVMLILAFVGSNQTRKNYYRAIFCWILVFLLPLICVVVFSAAHGSFPELQKKIQSWTHRA